MPEQADALGTVRGLMPHRSDRGFTLTEMLVSIVLGGIVMAAITQFAMIGLRTLDSTNERLAGSNDTQLVASWFTSDLASSEAVSTFGTTSHLAPSVATGNNGALVMFYALNRATTVESPAGSNDGWNATSTGTGGTNRLTIAMADEPGQSAGNTGIRVANSADPTSSIGHSVAINAALFSSVARRAASTAANGAANTLVIPKPVGTANGDVMLAHIAVAAPATAVTAPNGWSVLETRSGDTAQSVVYRKTATNAEPASYTWSFNVPIEAVGGVVGYSGASAVEGDRSEVSPCGGDTPALLLRWTDRETTVAHSVSYSLVTEQGENHLERRHCTGDTGAPDDTQTLATYLADAGVHADCSRPGCAPLPVTVTLTVSEPPLAHETVGRTYQLRAGTRTNV